MVEVTSHPHADSLDHTICARIPSDALHAEGAVAIYREIVRQIAERYVAEHYQDVVALIKPEAIATLVAAEAAAKIRESLEKNFPARVLEIERNNTVILQRGVLGGLKRV